MPVSSLNALVKIAGAEEHKPGDRPRREMSRSKIGMDEIDRNVDQLAKLWTLGLDAVLPFHFQGAGTKERTAPLPADSSRKSLARLAVFLFL